MYEMGTRANTSGHFNNPDASEGLRVLRLFLVIMAVVVFGTLGFRIIQRDWDLWQCLYFTLVTVTTVGYSDTGISPAGERFTTVLLVVGIGTASYAVSQLVQIAVHYQLAWRLRMQKRIDQLSGHLIICGLGRVGRSVCERLASDSEPFVVIEKNKDTFEQARENNYLVLNGSATEDEVLLLAGIKRARGIVCVVNSDSENIVITLSARELKPDILIISRSDEEGSARKLKRAGASHTISPATKSGDDIANLITRPCLAEFLQQSRQDGSEFKLGEIHVVENSPLVGQAIRQYGLCEPSISFLAIRHDDGAMQIRPGPDDTFDSGDIVIVVGDTNALHRMSDQALPSAA